MQILVAEDNRFYRQVLETTVRDWGYDVLSVDNGLAAWEVLQSKTAPYLAIVDWLMPGLTGPELCRKVRSLNRARPTYIIILTVKDGKEDILSALNSGADDYICKPFDVEELKARLQAGRRIVDLQASLADRVGVLETALLEAQKIEAVGRLAGGIAHDFNNILTVIIGYSEMLLEAVADDQNLRPSLETIKEACERGAALTRQLLAFARKQVLKPTVFEVNSCVVSVDKMLARLIGEDITVVTELGNALFPIEADVQQFEQVLTNLLLNARDAMPSGGTIRIRTVNTDVTEYNADEHPSVALGKYVVISVSDTGIGMDETTRKHIFEPFFTTKEVGKGTGLGLATVYGIIRQSGGYLRVESELGKGSRFHVYLPKSEKSTFQEMPQGSRLLSDCAGETILLVEDEVKLRMLLSSILTLHGYTVLEAADGAEALRISSQFEDPIHLLVTDMVMPGISGCETARLLAESRPEMRILYISGYTEDAWRYPGIESGKNLLQKPFTPEVLVAHVREELDRQPALWTPQLTTGLAPELVISPEFDS